AYRDIVPGAVQAQSRRLEEALQFRIALDIQRGRDIHLAPQPRLAELAGEPCLPGCVVPWRGTERQIALNKYIVRHGVVMAAVVKNRAKAAAGRPVKHVAMHRLPAVAVVEIDGATAVSHRAADFV